MGRDVEGGRGSREFVLCPVGRKRKLGAYGFSDKMLFTLTRVLLITTTDHNWRLTIITHQKLSILFIFKCHKLHILKNLKHITCDLSPSTHVNNIVAKAHQRANVIHKCFTSRNRNPLVRAYLTYVTHLLEYNSFWSPHLKYDVDAIEQVQRRFTKRIPGFGNCSYVDRLNLLNLLYLPKLEMQRIQNDFICCYKILLVM